VQQEETSVLDPGVVGKINTNIQKLVAKILELEHYNKQLQKEVDGLIGALITPENQAAFDLHMSMTDPIREANKKPEEMYPEEKIPVINIEEIPFG
jgi:hypothetical protein